MSYSLNKNVIIIIKIADDAEAKKLFQSASIYNR